VIDKREQTPWLFKQMDAQITYSILQYGDYSILGHQDQITIERKNINDLFSSIGRNHEDFMRKMKVLSEFKSKALVIEATYEQVVHPHKNYSRLEPAAVIGTLAKTISVYNVPVIFAGGRRHAQQFVYSMFVHFINNYSVNIPLDQKIKRTFTPMEL